MPRNIYTLLFCLLGIFSQRIALSAILVVNNSNANPGQYNSLQAAIDAAVDGDTLYVQPSTNNYGAVSVYKGLTLMGVGHRPKKDIPYIATIQSITLNNSVSNVKLIGLRIESLLLPCNCYACWQTTSNITVQNCDLSISDNNPNNCYGFNILNNLVIENSYLRNLSLPGTGNSALIRNCIFNAYACYFGPSFTNVVIRNNLFMYTSAVNNFSGNGMIVENNIFYRFTPYDNYNNLQNCVFNNNLTYQTNVADPVTGSNTGSNNIPGQDPLFVNVDLNSGDLFQPAIFNYRLQDLSPGKNAGTDGQDIGPYGGSDTFSETGEYIEMPVIREMNILNSTVPSGGVIQVQVKATKSVTDR